MKLYSSIDTFVTNVWYKKIEITFEGALRFNKPDAILIREDTLQGKIWYREINKNSCELLDTTEQLIVDFNLQKGDTFDMSNLSHAIFRDSLCVVDTVFQDNKNRKHIRFQQQINPPYQTFSYPLEFIEGVGPNISLMYRNTCNFGQRFVIVCAYKDNQQIFYDNRYNSCDPLKELL